MGKEKIGGNQGRKGKEKGKILLKIKFLFTTLHLLTGFSQSLFELPEPRHFSVLQAV